jgi:SpoVK/Ycf46/Vps4 family AAA+-type ATPase
VAGEIGARFMNVGISDVLNMWIGESERRLHELFENARRRAPTVLFFDELDALGQRRTEIRGAAIRTTINQLLSELDGFGGRNDQVFFLAATNHPWDIDPALRRPGRFDRLVFVAPPDLPARQNLLELKLKGRPIANRIDYARLLKASEGFSGADLAAVVELATELTIQKSLKQKKDGVIDDEALIAALKDTEPSTRPWFETARNYALYANEGGTYDELLPHLKKLGLS